MSAMPINNVFAGIAVADLDAALAWYARLLGRPADRIPMDGLAEWQVTEAGAIQLIRDAGRAGTGLLTLAVNDLEGYVAALAEIGLTPGAINTGVVARFAAITDLEGNTITLAELLGTDD